MTIEGYTLADFYNRNFFEHGGTAIFLKNGIEFKPRHDITKLSFEMNCEVAAIEIKLCKLIIICVYRPDYDYLIFEEVISNF